ncbi:MAG: Ig-like domain-containing protein [Thermoleophilaceae bacterium]
MTRRLAIVLTLVASLLLTLVADAGARRLHPQPTIHKASTAEPTVSKVTPLKAKVGDKLTITGKNFRGASKTKVFFMRKGGGITTAKPSSGSKTKLVVKIPASVTPLLRSGATTRFQIRVLTSRFGDPTKLSKSPLISPAPSDGDGGGVDTSYGAGDCDHDGIKNRDETDDDNDLIPDTVELGTTKTDECNADTDGDGVSDGYEWQSAKDMNDTTPFNTPDAGLPYPGKRPWPNPLDKSDANIDHDGDGLSMIEEYGLWQLTAHPLSTALTYSDGKQVSVSGPDGKGVPPVGWNDPKKAYLELRHNGLWTDDERDADGDGIGNWDESHGRLLQSWWKDAYKDETPYPDVMNGGELEYPGTDMLKYDTDGDGKPDGADDQDHDGLSNSFELSRAPFWQATYVSVGPVNAHDGVLTPLEQATVDAYNSTANYADGSAITIVGPNPWARTNPYNPCKPVYSKTCHVHWPFGWYKEDEDWMGVDPQSYDAPPAAPWLYDGEKTTIDSGPAAGLTTTDATPTFTFSSNNPRSTFECRLDSTDPNAWSSCSSPYTTGTLANGQHTFEVRSKDPDGNTDPTPASRTFWVDATTVIESGPAAGSAITDSTPTFGFSSNNPGSSFECSVDYGPWSPCTANPYTTGTLADGQHTFEVRSKDLAGNTDPTPARRKFTVDTTPPQTTIDSGPDAGSTINNSTPTFGFSSNEDGSSFECRVDSGAWIPSCSNPYTTDTLADGPHTFEVRATDQASNTDPTPASLTFTVDTTP